MSKGMTNERANPSEHSLRLTEFAVEVAADAMFRIAPDGRILAANSAACERLEYTRDELVGLYVSDIDPCFPPEAWPDHFDELRQNRSSMFETQHRTRSGRILHVEVSVAYFEFEGAEYACSSVRDVTVQKQAESLLRLQHDVLAMVASGVDEREVLVSLCQMVERMVPHSAASVMLVDEGDGCLHLEAGPQWSDELRSLIEPLPPGLKAGSCGASAYLKRPVIVPDTTTSPHWETLQNLVQKFNIRGCWSLPILDGDDQPLGTFAISHSQKATPTKFQLELLETACHLASIPIRRKRAQAELRRRQDELAHMSRLSTMGELASNTAHELNQPLTAVANFAYAISQMLGDDRPDLAKVRQFADDICEQALRAGDIMRSMRHLAKKTAPDRTAADLNSVIRKSLVLLEPDLRHNSISVTLGLDDDLPQCLIDSVQIQQVLINLIRNAIDAVQTVDRSKRVITISTLMSNTGSFEVRVGDSGPGIKQEDLASVFEAFYSTKDDGMGMGLAISRTIAETHFGRLSIENPGNQGAVFCLSLPGQRQEETP